MGKGGGGESGEQGSVGGLEDALVGVAGKNGGVPEEGEVVIEEFDVIFALEVGNDVIKIQGNNACVNSAMAVGDGGEGACNVVFGG